MSHSMELLSRLIKSLDAVKVALLSDEQEKHLEITAHSDLVNVNLGRLDRAIGPIFSSVEPVGDLYQATLTKSQMSFLTSHIMETLMLVMDSLTHRERDLKISAEADDAVDGLIRRFSDDEDPMLLHDMLSLGLVEDMKEELASLMKKGLNEEPDLIINTIASIAIDRSFHQSQSTNLLSLLHDIVEVGIGGRVLDKKALPQASNQIRKEVISEKVVRIDFSRGRSIPSKEDSQQEQPSEAVAN